MHSTIPYGRQLISQEDILAVAEVMQGDWLTGGPAVESFEKSLCDYTGARHAIAVSSGTAALHVAMLAAGIGRGEKVITSPNTFLASANCAEYVGARVDFADIDPETYNLSPDTLKEVLSEQTKAVVAVDFAGRPCNMPEIAKEAREHGTIIIEDAAHALGSQIEYEGESYMVGSHPWADMTTFSFHPVKTLTTGEGGAILTNDDNLAKRCRLFRNHGMEKTRREEPWFYEMNEIGFNYRITDIQCALGQSQMNRLGGFIQRRQEIVDSYNKAFSDMQTITCPNPAPSGRVAWHLYVVQIDFKTLGKSRTQVMNELMEMGIGSQVHYIPVHLQPYYKKKYGYRAGKCPNAETFYEKCLSLPLHPSMSEDDTEKVINSVHEVLS